MKKVILLVLIIIIIALVAIIIVSNTPKKTESTVVQNNNTNTSSYNDSNEEENIDDDYEEETTKKEENTEKDEKKKLELEYGLNDIGTSYGGERTTAYKTKLSDKLLNIKSALITSEGFGYKKILEEDAQNKYLKKDVETGGVLIFKDDDTFFYSRGVYADTFDLAGRYIIDMYNNKIVYRFHNGTVEYGTYKIENGTVKEVTYKDISQRGDDGQDIPSFVFGKNNPSQDLPSNLNVLYDYTTDFYNYSGRKEKYFNSPAYSIGDDLVNDFIFETIQLANSNPNKQYIVYISKSEEVNNSHILYMGRFAKEDEFTTLRNKVIDFMRSKYAHEAMNEKSPRYDGDKEYDIRTSYSASSYIVEASGKILNITSTDGNPRIDRLYPGEI